LIRFHSVRKVFAADGGEVVAVAGLDLDVDAGETVCLIGTSGSGKTTALKMVNRLLEPTAGQIQVDDADVCELDLIELRRSIGYVIQGGGLFPHWSVAENVGLLPRLAGWDPARLQERVGELLELVNLPGELARRRPRELSGGQRQRVGVARALALDPKIVLMDEPFGSLDPITRDDLHEEFLGLVARLRTTILLVTHDLHEAFKLGNRVALMDGGQLLQVGTQEDFHERPANDFVAAFLSAHGRGTS
jgi:osmoprotectant transport system ATP-binding protein